MLPLIRGLGHAHGGLGFNPEAFPLLQLPDVVLDSILKKCHGLLFNKVHLHNDSSPLSVSQDCNFFITKNM